MILLIDSYDSFTNNLFHLIKETTEKEVIIIHNDTFKPEEYDNFFKQYVPRFDYIVIGPGPGNPSNPEDTGIIGPLLRYLIQGGNECVPVLGICLGFQCISYETHNNVPRLNDVKHGQVYKMHPTLAGKGLFNDYDVSFNSVRYHSLHVELVNDEIIPLAYCFEDAEKQRGILMAGKHKNLPLYGVQYHPESICSDGGSDLIRNFDRIAMQFNDENRKGYVKLADDRLISLRNIQQNKGLKPEKLMETVCETNEASNFSVVKIDLKGNNGDVKPIEICEYFYERDKEANFMLLNSASFPGEWSIICLPKQGKSETLTHSVDENNKVLINRYKSHEVDVVELKEDESFWSFLGKKMASSYVSREKIHQQLGKDYHTREFPFFGGYVGYLSYEEGRHIMINKLNSLCKGNTPDAKFTFIERFLIHDNLTNDWFIASCSSENDDKWVNEIKNELYDSFHAGKLNLDVTTIPDSVQDLALGDEKVTFDFPLQEIYKEQFNCCQELLHSGDSYELCLTTQLKIRVPATITPWQIYKILTKKNPSPFSCFMEFDDSVLISSSPERFLSWKDGEGNKKAIELRPIKGTVRKTPGMTKEKASAILQTPKEIGENLMIVDLIRHDLHQFTNKVTVPQLMVVEEYKTVFQLVSAIYGNLQNDGYRGLDMLHLSLPPGSMTGAPKKRSVELLQDIESMQPNGNTGGRRGIYSGVVGYWSVTDDSDWSVVIRSIFHYRDDVENNSSSDLWRIGAGGAITVLSEPESEWEELKTKLESALQAFTRD